MEDLGCDLMTRRPHLLCVVAIVISLANVAWNGNLAACHESRCFRSGQGWSVGDAISGQCKHGVDDILERADGHAESPSKGRV